MEDRLIDFYIKSIENIENKYEKISGTFPREIEDTCYFLSEAHSNLINSDNIFYTSLLESDRKIQEYYRFSTLDIDDSCDTVKKFNREKTRELTESIGESKNKLEKELGLIYLKNHIYQVRNIIENHTPQKNS